GSVIRETGNPRSDVLPKIEFDDLLLQSGNKQLEANPTGHHFGLDVALSLIKDEAGRLAMIDVVELLKTKNLSDPKLKQSAIDIGLRLVMEIAKEMSDPTKLEQRDAHLSELKSNLISNQLPITPK